MPNYQRQRDADNLDHALFTAWDRMRAFAEAHPEAVRMMGDTSREKAWADARDAISKLRHHHVRPFMNAKKREETGG